MVNSILAFDKTENILTTDTRRQSADKKTFLPWPPLDFVRNRPAREKSHAFHAEERIGSR